MLGDWLWRLKRRFVYVSLTIILPVTAAYLLWQWWGWFPATIVALAGLTFNLCRPVVHAHSMEHHLKQRLYELAGRHEANARKCKVTPRDYEGSSMCRDIEWCLDMYDKLDVPVATLLDHVSLSRPVRQVLRRHLDLRERYPAANGKLEIDPRYRYLYSQLSDS